MYVDLKTRTRNRSSSIKTNLIFVEIVFNRN